MNQESLTSFPVYYQSYVAQVPEESAIDALNGVTVLRQDLLSSWPSDRADYAYADGKWTVKELLIHLMDAERVFVYRALRFSRNDTTDLPGYDHNGYVPESGAENRTLADVVLEMEDVRNATIAFFKNLSAAQLQRSGTANGLEMGVEQLAFIIAGHERHHLAVLAERYKA